MKILVALIAIFLIWWALTLIEFCLHRQIAIDVFMTAFVGFFALVRTSQYEIRVVIRERQ